MVQIQRLKTNRRSPRSLLLVLSALIFCGVLAFFYQTEIAEQDHHASPSTNKAKPKLRYGDSEGSSSVSLLKPKGESMQHDSLAKISVSQEDGADSDALSDNSSIPCVYKQLSDLKEYEAHPTVTEDLDGNQRRHAYEPPKDGVVTLVCCTTTAGNISVAVHNTWAPLGAANFLRMVTTKYFSSRVALMRCVRNFLCQ